MSSSLIDGDERVLTYHNARREEQGQAPYVLGHAQDITDRQRVEAALAASEQRFARSSPTRPLVLRG